MFVMKMIVSLACVEELRYGASSILLLLHHAWSVLRSSTIERGCPRDEELAMIRGFMTVLSTIRCTKGAFLSFIWRILIRTARA